MHFQKNGMGDIVPGLFTLPENPVIAAINAYQAMQTKPVKGHGVGDFVNASFVVPQNPISSAPTGNALMTSLQGLACGNSCMECDGYRGMGALDYSSPSAILSSIQHGSSFGISNLYLVLGGAALFLVLPALLGGKKGRR